MNKNEIHVLSSRTKLTRMENETQKVNESKSQTRGKMGYAMAGYAVGAMSGVAVGAYADTLEIPVAGVSIQDEVMSEEASVPGMQENVAEYPQQEGILLATNEGIRVAQVSDDASFEEAFADARAQVGPGGVFEWQGCVYNTYYKEEWDSMDAEGRALFQSQIDYNKISGTEDVSEHYQVEEVVASNAELTDNGRESADVKVLGVEAVTDVQGRPMVIAGVEMDGQQALLVDVDNDSTMDVIMTDINGDGQISEYEIYDFSGANVSVNDLQQYMAMQQNPNELLACNDGMPDYVNDADVSSLA